MAEPGWTLMIEAAFYALFAGALVLSRRWRATVLVATLATFAAVGAGSTPDRHAALRLYTDSIVVELGLGVGLGWWHSARDAPAGVRGHWVVGGALALTGLVPLVLPDPPSGIRGLAWGLPALSLVGGALLLEPMARRLTHPVPLLLGDASYSLYLSHGLAVSAGLWLGSRVAPASPQLALALMLALALPLAAAAHLLIERPIDRWLRARIVPDATR